MPKLAGSLVPDLSPRGMGRVCNVEYLSEQYNQVSHTSGYYLSSDVLSSDPNHHLPVTLVFYFPIQILILVFSLPNLSGLIEMVSDAVQLCMILRSYTEKTEQLYENGKVFSFHNDGLPSRNA